MDVTIRRILFPTDFSQSSVNVRNYAVTLAKTFGAELHVLHVAADPAPLPGSLGLTPPPDVDLLPQIVDAARRRLASDFPESSSDGLKIVRVVRSGNAVPEIIDYAHSHQMDLNVIGTHGRTGLSHLLIGSVAEKTVRLAKCPVLSVHPEAI